MYFCTKTSTHMSENQALRWGYTTGSCAAAAAYAATLYLIDGQARSSVTITLPGGQQAVMGIQGIWMEAECACASVVKDGGDDPDATHGLEIIACVGLQAEPGIYFIHGEGVGTVTLPGLEIPVGAPAINPVPRKMIAEHISQACSRHGIAPGAQVQIRVPQGREVGAHTFNPRLGIMGGISILGTTGLVKPYSSEAFIESIRRGLQVAKALGSTHAVLNSGGRSEAYLRRYLPHLHESAFVQYGNWIGESLQIVQSMGFKTVTMGMMLGKAAKLAQGMLNTHSKESVFDPLFLCSVAESCSYPAATVDAIRQLALARNITGIIPFSVHEPFYAELARRCRDTCRCSVLQILLVGQDGEILDFSSMQEP